MTDPDRPAGSFLERWSRKKIDAERESSEAARAQEVSPSDKARSPEQAAKADSVPAKTAPKPEFDLASLPSLDSITAVTDVRAFLAPGVPKELARAALRRAWSADPAIRDFKGLAENDWDFTDPAAMPGFGALPEGTDVKKLVAQIFGDSEKPAEPAAPVEQPPNRQIAGIAAENAQLVSSEAAASLPPVKDQLSSAQVPERNHQGAATDMVQRDNNIASHNSIPGDEPEEGKKRRQHGGALPQ